MQTSRKAMDCWDKMQLILLLIGATLHATAGSESAAQAAVDALSTQVSGFQTTDKALIKLKDLVSVKSATLKAELTKVHDAGTLTKISTSLTTAAGSMSKFTSTSAKTVAEGAVGMVSAFAPLIGSFLGPVGTVAGSVVGALAAIINGILGLFGAGKVNMKDVVQNAIDDALRNQYVKEKLAQAHGVATLFSTSQNYLKGVRDGNGNITASNIESVRKYLPALDAIPFIGELEYNIKADCTQTDKNKLLERAKACLAFAEVYSNLGIMQDTLFMEEYVLIKEVTPNSPTLSGIETVRQGRIDEAKDLLEFFHNPTLQNAVPVNIYKQTEHPLLDQFMTYVGIGPAEDESWRSMKKFVMFPQKWPTWYAKGCINAIRDQMYMCGTTTTPYDRYGIFRFRVVDLIGNFFDLKADNCPVLGCYVTAWSDNYARLKDIHTSLNKGDISIMKMKGATDFPYVLSTKEWPDKFFYMDSGHRGWIMMSVGDPGTQGYWKLKEV